MTIEYAHEKLRQAMRSLATGSGGLHERLREAGLILIRLKPDDFPDKDLRRIFTGLLDDLTYAEPQRGEARISATLRVTSDEDARAIAGRIIDLYHKIDYTIFCASAECCISLGLAP